MSVTELKHLKKSAEANSELYKESMSNQDSYSILEAFPNPAMEYGKGNIGINIVTNEFTSLCPITGQPDFAKIIIDYYPSQLCVESKSLKLYLLSFRNVGMFHEGCVVKIGQDLVKLLNPFSLEVKGEFSARGGIPIWPTFFYSIG